MRPFRLGFTPFIEPQVISTVCDAYRELFPKGSIYPENGDTEVLGFIPCPSNISKSRWWLLIPGGQPTAYFCKLSSIIGG